VDCDWLVSVFNHRVGGIRLTRHTDSLHLLANLGHVTSKASGKKHVFTKLLIANRGEIACRIIETARRMKIATVAVYSDADANARHVRLADEAAYLGPSPAAHSYLRGDLILTIARERGAQAIHPGYGFLSENAEFAEACDAAGIVFVGPRAQAIRDMGLKDRAKAIAVEVGAPVLPGYWGEDQSEKKLLAEAQKIGFPLLVKAVAGGGGRGIRMVESAKELASALASAKREAAAAFGDDRMMLERLVQRPRHLEVQVFGDQHGGLVHLFERDCSIQRRRQKIVEEAPAPGMTQDVRDSLTQAALKIARAVNYSNAGTIEFVADGTGPLRPDGFWFLEMNTRLQVEHPVTEAITGLDLVEWQLRVAAGEKLPLSQDAITMTGASIEARIVAEDPAKGFLPSSGVIGGHETAGTVRVDRGFDVGDVFPDAYDSLVEKIIAHGTDRAAALDTLSAALETKVTTGITTNTGYLARLLGIKTFVSGAVHTGLLEDEARALEKPPADAARLAGLAAIGVQLAREHKAQAARSPFAAADGWRMNAGPVLTVRFDLETGPLMAAIEADTVQLSARVGGDHAVVARRTASCTARARDYMIQIGPSGRNQVTIFVTEAGATLVEAGEVWSYPFPVADAASDALEAVDEIKATLPGKIALVNVSPGTAVAKGEVVVVLEAMKMEHSLVASRDGVIGEVLVTVGRQVRAGDVLVRLQPQDAA
jgi:3-methylcrotonyl-CoA carboxylase alpha subunit